MHLDQSTLFGKISLLSSDAKNTGLVSVFTSLVRCRLIYQRFSKLLK